MPPASTRCKAGALGLHMKSAAKKEYPMRKKTPVAFTSVLAASLLSSLLGCTGRLGGDSGPDDPPSGPTSSAFKCDATLVPETVPLRRLSKVQYENTVGDIVGFALGDEREAVMAKVTPMLAGLPDDERKGPSEKYGGLKRLDQTVQQTSVDQSYAIAVAIGAALTSTPERLGKVAGACASDADASNDGSCLDELIRKLGEQTLRRAITDEDVAFYRDVAGAPPFDAPDYADVIAMLMTAPGFLYFVEHGAAGSAADAASAKLSAYELVTRLSYHFWQTTPDAELLDAARSGAILTEDVYAAQVERIFADARTRQVLKSFYAEWLFRPDLDPLDSRLGTPRFDAFRGDFTPTPGLRERMFSEVSDMAMFYSLSADGKFDDLFGSTKSFATTDDLASLYGVPAWDGKGAPPDFPDPTRVGLLGRAAMTATGSVSSRPIMKGVFIRKALLCEGIPAPPNNASASKPEAEKTLTTRGAVEQLTEKDGTACAGCHKVFINGLGFATEGFDALGRSRKEETIFDRDTGAELAKLLIDTKSVPMVKAGDTTVSTGVVDLNRILLDSGKPQACFAREYFRFTFAREEDLVKDGCALASLQKLLVSHGSISSVLRAIALDPAFRQRSFL